VRKAADAVHSSVASDLLLLAATEKGHTTAAYTSLSASQAEDDGSSAASAFLSIQPPTDATARVRHRAEALFSEAESVLADIRIAARRGDHERLRALQARANRVAKRLEQLAELGA
jgi:hypothetical protein